LSKNAEEMFKDLKYKKVLRGENRITYVQDIDELVDKEVIFFFESKSFLVQFDLTGESTLVDMELLKAINKQIEELKWIQ
jgi:hypothetical protein